jgi:hypothetical protein
MVLVKRLLRSVVLGSQLDVPIVAAIGSAAG